MWRFAHAHPELTCFNEPTTIRKKGRIDAETMRRALGLFLERHETWRSRFTIENGEAFQTVMPFAEPCLTVESVASLPESERKASALAMATRESRIPFDLERGPLARFLLVQFAAEEWLLFVTAHHLVLDGVSVFEILYSDLTTIYDALEAGRTPDLPRLNLRYSEFADWQRNQITRDKIDSETAFWREKLSGYRPFTWPTARPHPPTHSLDGAIRSFSLPEQLSSEVRRFSSENKVTLFVMLMSAFALLLHRYTGESDLTVGTVTPGWRKLPEAQGVMGLFQNRAPMRMALDPDIGVREWMLRIRNAFVDTLSHDDVPFDSITAEICPEREPFPNPFYQAMFTLEPPLPTVGAGWDLTTMDFDPGGARCDLYIEMDPREKEIHGRAQYRTGVFLPSEIEMLIRDFQDTLELMVSSTGRLSEGLSRITRSHSTALHS
jgi:hypothetical protein